MTNQEMENPKAKLTFTHWNETVSIEVDRSDITIDEFFELAGRLAKASGYAEKSVKEYIEV